MTGVEMQFARLWTTVKDRSETRLPVWRRATDELGRTYYWNVLTREARWWTPAYNPPFAYADVTELCSHPLFAKGK